MAHLAADLDVVTAPAVKATTTATFSADVIAESARQPVLVHFLSARSEACRTLQSTLERTVRATGGKVALVTMDIDAHPQIAGRLGVRAVPAVYAFQRGQPIDGFMGALPEAEIKGFLERLVGPMDDGTDEVLETAETALAGGDAQQAADLYASILDRNPEHPAALGGLARALIAGGDLDSARALLAQAPTTGVKDKAIAAAQAALDLAEQAGAIGDVDDLRRKIEAAPDDHQVRFDLAIGLAAQGDRDAAANMLIESLKRDRTWNEGAARKQLLQFFEAWGLMDPVTLAARRKLSTLLFA